MIHNLIMNKKYLIVILIFLSINFVLASTCPMGVYPCDEKVQFNNPITQTSNDIINNYISSGNPFDQSLNTTDEVEFKQINVTMDTTQRQAIIVDGTTNDWNGEYTGITNTINDFSRDYNVGTGRPENVVLIKSTLNLKHTNANLSGATPYSYGMSFQVNENGNRTNWNGTSSTSNVYGIQGTLLPAQTLDTKSTGGIIYQQYGVSALISSSEKLFDSGGQNPTHALYSYGVYSQIVSNPIDIGSTWTINNYGQYISVAGNKNGTSTNYGLYIATTSGADNNYAVYDATTTDWIKSGGNLRIMRSDTSKLIMGAGEDAQLWYNGSDVILAPRVVGTGKLYIYGSISLNDTLITSSNRTTQTCNTANEGGIYYDGTTKKHYGCNSTQWNALY